MSAFVVALALVALVAGVALHRGREGRLLPELRSFAQRHGGTAIPEGTWWARPGVETSHRGRRLLVELRAAGGFPARRRLTMRLHLGLLNEAGVTFRLSSSFSADRPPDGQSFEGRFPWRCDDSALAKALLDERGRRLVARAAGRDGEGFLRVEIDGAEAVVIEDYAGTDVGTTDAAFAEGLAILDHVLVVLAARRPAVTGPAPRGVLPRARTASSPAGPALPPSPPDGAGIRLLSSHVGEGGDPTEALCQVCGEAVGASGVRCRRCATPHHEDCWRFTGRCSTYGCGCEDCLPFEGDGRA